MTQGSIKPDKASVRRAQTKIYHANLEAGNTLSVHSTFDQSHFGLCLRCRALVITLERLLDGSSVTLHRDKRQVFQEKSERILTFY